MRTGTGEPVLLAEDEEHHQTLDLVHATDGRTLLALSWPQKDGELRHGILFRLTPERATAIADGLLAWARGERGAQTVRQNMALTADDLASIRELAEAASPGELSWGAMRAEHVAQLADKTAAIDGTDPTEMWTTWLGPADDALIVAVTGNGPTSKANARFFSRARMAVLALLDEIAERDRRIANLSGPSKDQQGGGQ